MTSTDPVTRAETELRTRLTAHIPDEPRRAQLAARFIADLLGQGWRPPQQPPDPLAARRDATVPNEAWHRAKRDLKQRAHQREEAA